MKMAWVIECRTPNNVNRTFTQMFFFLNAESMNETVGLLFRWQMAKLSMLSLPQLFVTVFNFSSHYRLSL